MLSFIAIQRIDLAGDGQRVVFISKEQADGIATSGGDVYIGERKDGPVIVVFNRGANGLEDLGLVDKRFHIGRCAGLSLVE